MKFETVLVEIRERLGFISLNRPEKMNTFSSQLARELNDALRQLDAHDEVQVVIVKGAGKAFSTGIDISEFPGKTTQEYQAWIAQMDEMHLTIAEMAKPVIAMVHGFAVANGAGLLAAADFAIVAEGTKIGTTAIRVGLLCTGPIIPLSYAMGILNLRLRREYEDERRLLETLPHIEIEGFRDGERTFGPVICHRAKINDAEDGALISAVRTHYAGDVIELIAPSNLRAKLELKDGDIVKVRITSSSPGRTSA